MKKTKIVHQWQASNQELDQRQKFYRLFKSSPIPEDELLQNLGLYLKRQDLTRILFFNELYQQILNTHGIIIEFGVRWGHNLALFESFRGIYEPFNHSRKIVGFDTFSGFPNIHEKDGHSESVKTGSLNVSDDYDQYLQQVLDYHESESPVPQIKKYELVKGDATKTIHQYLKNNPQTIIALAYFDFDIYKPTRECLEVIKPHLTKGSILGFDQLSFATFPGETHALKEVLGLDAYAIKRNQFSSYQSYLIID